MGEELCKVNSPVQKGPQLGLKHVSIQSEQHLYSTWRQEEEKEYYQSTALLSSHTQNTRIYTVESLPDFLYQDKTGESCQHT